MRAGCELADLVDDNAPFNGTAVPQTSGELVPMMGGVEIRIGF